jgi:SAM-dependent methyltransferase
VSLIDPEDLELATLRALADFTGQRVLEVGAGDGRLAWSLSADARLWLALEPDLDELAVAAHDQPYMHAPGVRLLAGDGRQLALPTAAVDTAFFTWSLCCIPPEHMPAALAEAARVLRPGGTLVDIHPTDEPLWLELWTRSDDAPEDSVAPDDHERAYLGALAPGDMTPNFAAATATLAAAPEQGYTLEDAAMFDFRIFFDTLDELGDYLEENDEFGLAGDELLEAALLGVQAATRPARLVLVQSVSVSRYRRL